MARYSRRRGPALQIALTLADQFFPELTVTRHFDDGELFIIGRIWVRSVAPGTDFAVAAIWVDGVRYTPSLTDQKYTAADDDVQPTPYAFIPVSAGLHTIQLSARHSLGIAANLLADASDLTVIQFPQWDTEDDILGGSA